jgi:hypothetical protein
MKPRIRTQEEMEISRSEHEAWLDLATIIREKDQTNHLSGCTCDTFACRVFNAIRNYSVEYTRLYSQEQKAIKETKV